MEPLDALMDSFIEKGLFKGATVLAGSSKKDLFAYSRGLADPLAGRPWARDTIIDISSVTKAIGTATAAALCIERGLIDPDACFTRYLPPYTGRMAVPVTIRHLACHYSGVKPNYRLVDDPALLLKNILSSNFTAPPMTRYLYSCVNYHFMALMIEHVTGAALDAFAQEHIFAPLGMTDTRWDRLARTGRDMDREPGLIFDLWASVLYPRAAGNAGLFTTAADIAKFARMMAARGKGFFKTDRMVAELFASAAPPGSGLLPRSFGWNKDPAFIPAGLSETETVFHTGSSGQSVWIDPKSDRFIIVLTNLFGDHGAAGAARYRIASAVVKAL